MNIADARTAYARQVSGAKRRGVGWEITFEQWLEWWGADLALRGSGPDDLQMCRHGDEGPYALGNIYKGTKRENTRTAARLAANRRSEARKRAHQQHLDALKWAASGEPSDVADLISDDEFDRLRATGAIPGNAHSRFLDNKPH